MRQVSQLSVAGIRAEGSGPSCLSLIRWTIPSDQPNGKSTAQVSSAWRVISWMIRATEEGGRRSRHPRTIRGLRRLSFGARWTDRGPRCATPRQSMLRAGFVSDTPLSQLNGGRRANPTEVVAATVHTESARFSKRPRDDENTPCTSCQVSAQIGLLTSTFADGQHQLLISGLLVRTPREPRRRTRGDPLTRVLGDLRRARHEVRGPVAEDRGLPRSAGRVYSQALPSLSRSSPAR